MKSPAVPTVLGTHLKKAREDMGLTADDVESETGISASAVSHIETGRRRDPRISTLSILFRAYKIPFSKLEELV